MKLYDFYFYSYLASQVMSTDSSLVAPIKTNLLKINILVCLWPQPLIFWLLVFKSEAKTLLNFVSVQLNRYLVDKNVETFHGRSLQRF